MKTITIAYLLLFFSLLLLNCNSMTIKRYKDIEKSVEKDSLVEIRLFGSRIAPSQNGAKKNMLLLSDHGQAEYIKENK